MVSDVLEDNEALLSLEEDDNYEWILKFDPQAFS